MKCQPREFTCTDCGWDVVSWGEQADNEQDICAQCSWLRDIKNEAERDKLRKFLQEQRR